MPYTFTKTGTGHLERNEENQDVVHFEENGRYSVITLADGVSSCTNGKEGAEIASRELKRLLFEKASHFMSFDEGTVAELSLAHILWELERYARENQISVEELSSTLAGALYDKKTKQLLLVNLGDGMIITGNREGCFLAARPSDSRYGTTVTTTYGARNEMKVRKLDGTKFESVYLCSAGAWRCMFDRIQMTEPVQKMIRNNNYRKLGTYLTSRNPFDDCTFVGMKLKQKYERKTA